MNCDHLLVAPIACKVPWVDFVGLEFQNLCFSFLFDLSLDVYSGEFKWRAGMDLLYCLWRSIPFSFLRIVCGDLKLQVFGICPADPIWVLLCLNIGVAFFRRRFEDGLVSCYRWYLSGPDSRIRIANLFDTQSLQFVVYVLRELVCDRVWN